VLHVLAVDHTTPVGFTCQLLEAAQQDIGVSWQIAVIVAKGHRVIVGEHICSGFSRATS